MSNVPKYTPYPSDSDTSSDDESTDSYDIYYTSKDSLLKSPETPPILSPNKVFGQIFRSTETKAAAPPPSTSVANVDTLKDAGVTMDFKESKNTTLFMINSRDRDTNVYPQPTFFTLRLPRVFRNITTLNMSQINLL